MSGQLKVLIVDDEEGIVDYMNKILNLKGYKTFVALDSDRAIELFKAEHPQICLLDVHLSFSKLNGIQILEEFKKIDPKVECVMITRVTDPEMTQKAKELGSKSYLLKPVDTKDLLSLLKILSDNLKNNST